MSFISTGVSNSMFLDLTSETEILSVVRLLRNKKSLSDDNLSMYLVKEIISTIITPITHIFNLSLKQGIFPSQFKISKIIPIFKKGKTDDIKNYRPISLLSPLSKILEKLIFVRLSHFLSKNHLLNDNQYGFRNNHSTELAIIELTQRIMNNMNDKHLTVGVFLDLSKAFDVIDHNLLIKKLNSYGVRGIANNWFKSYLDSRKQYVSINNFNSNFADVVNGVPQGSILGPMLFLIFINDICKVSSQAKCILYADDTNIFYTSKNIINDIDLINTDLNKFSDWFNSNRLTVNCSKSSFVIFGPKILTNTLSNVIINLNNDSIPRVSHIKLLGLTICENLSWQYHINNVSTKINKLTGIFRKLKNKLNPSILHNLYYSFIYPNITYGITLWGNSPNIHLIPIVRSQKKYIRLIGNIGPFDTTVDLFNNLNILNVKNIYFFFISVFIFKFLFKLLPPFFNDFFIFSKSIKKTTTRHTPIFYTYKTRLKIYTSSIKYTGPKIWDQLIPEHLKNISTLNSFKRELKLFLLTNKLDLDLNTVIT